jgi:hypothetical protein
MDQEPREAPETVNGKPNFFKNINGVIAGITALLAALAGLATVTKGFWGDKPAAQQGTAATTTNKPTGGPKTSPADAARPKIYTGVLFADGTFGGGAMSLKHEGENWILTADKAYEYEQLATSSNDKILAYNSDYGSYLSWPVDGGEVEESVDKKKNWSPYAKVTASEPSSN